MVPTVLHDIRQLAVEIFMDKNVFVVEGSEVKGEIFMEVEAMVEETVSEEALDEPGCSVFF